MNNYLDNGQKVPSLIEIATAYEDGNEGNVKQKEKGIYETYQDLTDDEKRFVFRHPMLAYDFNNNANKARSAVEHFPDKEDGYGDAVRHCYWCALNQMAAGLNSPLAKEFGDAHENTPKNDINAKTMDLHNNSVGYYLGNQAIINSWDEEELLKNVINTANNGKLYMLK